MIVAACPPAFVVVNVQPNGVYVCARNHESAGLNDERWLDISFPAFHRCPPGQIAFASSLTTVGCRRRAT